MMGEPPTLSPVPRKVAHVDTGVHDLVALVAQEVADKLAGRIDEKDVERSREFAASSDSMRAAIQQQARRYVVKWAVGILTTVAAGGFTTWKLAGPEQAIERAGRAADHADEKAVELEQLRATVEANEAERETERRALVDGRIGGLEKRTASVEGKLAGTDSKIDALIDVSMDERAAKRVKAKARATAVAVESAASEGL